MQIVADRAADVSPEQLEGLVVHYIPLMINLDGRTYASGVDIQVDEFYRLLSKTSSFPTTSQPSVGDFVEIYKQLAQNDPDILSIHVSSGLSGTVQTARLAASLVPEAHVTIVDSKTLSCPLGWQVEAAARAVKARWSVDKILPQLEQVRDHSDGFFTLSNLKYLIHGGRISHLKGLMASMLNIKPIITVEKVHGIYITSGQEITLKRAINKIVDVVSEVYSGGYKLRVQLLHGDNLEGVEILRQGLSKMFKCQWLPTLPVAPVLGAHTGPSLVGLAVGSADLFGSLS